MELNIGFDVKPLRDDDREKIMIYINSLSYWHLITLENKAGIYFHIFNIENLKSTILAIALHNNQIDVGTALCRGQEYNPDPADVEVHNLSHSIAMANMSQDQLIDLAVQQVADRTLLLI